MAVTTAYGFSFVENLDVDSIAANADAASLDGGGVVVTGDGGGQTIFRSFEPNGDRAGFATLIGAESAVSQLSNGNIVIAADGGDRAVFTVLDSDAVTVVPTTGVGESFSQLLDVDVTGLTGGGFVIASQAFFGGTNNDIRINIRDNDGTGGTNFTIDASTTANDQNPSVAGLADGGFAVAWHRNVGGGSELWWAVYEANGAVRKPPVLFDNTGMFNQNASVVALGDGGFAIAYEDSVGGDFDIILARFDASGAFVDQDDISQTTENDTAPSATVLSNGMIVVGYVNDSFDGEHRQTLVDQNTGEVLVGQIFVEQGAAASSSVAGMDRGQLATFYTNASTGDVVGKVLQGIRVTTGDAAADSIIGDDLVDLVTGGDGGDTIRGGLNADRLEGEAGDDTFLMGLGEAGGDTIEGGVDLDRILAISDIDLRTSSLTSIEKIDFFDGLSTLSPTKTVDVRADQIGGAGLASDLLLDGNSFGITDILRVTMGADAVVNLSAFTFQDFDITDGDRVVVTGDGDGERITGSSLRDVIAGAGGADTLTGGGGVDVMRGGQGDDSYIVDARGEAVEAANQGADTVRSNVDYALGANLETLVLIGPGATDGRGNVGANAITGNGAANVINGLGGDDTLTGGAGADRFLFTTALSAATNVDRIADFVAGVDEIRLDDAVFAGLPVGALAPGRFHVGAAAADGNDRIIYNAANGALFFDVDGAGGAAQVRFAALGPGPAPSAGDFVVI